MKRPHEVRQIAEADVVRDVGNRPIARRKQAGGAAQARPEQILMRRRADDRREEPEKMKRAETGGRGGGLEIDRLVEMILEPQRDVDRAPPIPCARRKRRRLRARRPFGEARGEGQRELVDAGAGVPVHGGLRLLGGHDELKGKLAIANAKLAYQRYKQLFSGERWAPLAARGATRQIQAATII